MIDPTACPLAGGSPVAFRHGVERTSARLLTESRAVFEFGGYAIGYPWFSLLPKGDGHPVLVLPGFSASDLSTIPIRNVLKRLGYRSHGWGLGTNRGPDDALLRAMRDRLEELSARYDQMVSIVGWSLGGVYARGLARRHPELVRQVITLGSPFRSVEAARQWPAPSVPTTAVYSKRDAVVDWENAQEPAAPRRESVEVDGSHFGLGHNPAVIVVVADRLAQAPDRWRPFEPPRRLRWLFSSVD